MPLKFATRRAAAKQNNDMSTRSAVDEIRRTTGEMLNGFMTARLAQTKATQKGLHKEDLTRARQVRSMMDGFRKEREANARQMRENLQNYVHDVHNSVVNSMREADHMLHDIASKRQKFAASLMKSLLRTHKSDARVERKELQELHNAREEATRKVRSNLNKFADELHHDVSNFRSELREQLGTPMAKPAKAPKKAAQPAAKTVKPVAKAPKAKAASPQMKAKSNAKAPVAHKAPVARKASGRKTAQTKK